MKITIKTKWRRNTAVSKRKKDEANAHQHTCYPVNDCELFTYIKHSKTAACLSNQFK